MAVQIQLRRDTAANWTSENPTLAAGEVGIETDTLKYKFGDGATAWNSLDYGVFDGASGGFVYHYSTTTTDSDPGSGNLRFDNSTFGSIANVFVDDEDMNGTDLSDWLDTFDDSTTADRGRLKIVKRSDPSAWRLFRVTGTVTDGTGYRKVAVTPLLSSGTFSDTDQVVVLFTPTGSAGFSSGFRFTFQDATDDSDPGAGNFKANHGTFGSITELYVDDADDGGADVTAWLDGLDDSTTANHKGYLRIEKASDAGAYMEFVVTGTVTDGTGYRKVPVDPQASDGTIADEDQIVVTFQRTGDAGSVGAQSDGASIDDDNGNELLEFGVTASAVNHVKVKNAATGNAPEVQAVGGDTNIDLVLKPKGSGSVLWDADLILTTGSQTLDAAQQAQVRENIGADLLARGNYIINGDGAINQRGAGSGLADDTYGHDRHYVLTQTGTIAVSSVPAPADGLRSMWRLTQSQATAQRMGYAQIIKATDSYGLRGRTVTLAGKLNYSNAAAVRYAVLEWTGTADTVTSDVVASWTSGTFTAGNFFLGSNLTVAAVGTITPSASTITPFALTADISSSANNVIVFMWTEGTAAQNSTLDGAWYLVEGDVTNDTVVFPHRHSALERLLCGHFFKAITVPSSAPVFPGNARSTSVVDIGVQFSNPMRTTPTFSYSGTPDIIGTTGDSLNNFSLNTANNGAVILRWGDTGTPFTTGNAYALGGSGGDLVLKFDAEL